jgi:hypothetical protein
MKENKTQIKTVVIKLKQKGHLQESELRGGYIKTYLKERQYEHMDWIQFMLLRTGTSDFLEQSTDMRF